MCGLPGRKERAVTRKRMISERGVVALCIKSSCCIYHSRPILYTMKSLSYTVLHVRENHASRRPYKFCPSNIYSYMNAFLPLNQVAVYLVTTLGNRRRTTRTVQSCVPQKHQRYTPCRRRVRSCEGCSTRHFELIYDGVFSTARQRSGFARNLDLASTDRE